MPHGHADLGEVDSPVRLLRPGPVRPPVPDAAAVRRRHTAGPRRRWPNSGRRAGRWMPRTTCPIPITLITDPAQERQQPRQPHDDRRVDVPRPVPRSRHDLRPDVEPRAPAGPGVDPQLPHPGARPRQSSTAAGPVCLPAPLRPDGRRRVAPRFWSRRSRARQPCRSTASPVSTCPRNSQQTRADRRSAQRREPHRLPAAPGLPRLPQPRRRRRRGRARAPVTRLPRSSREAQRVVRWHYQWLVLHEFLPPNRRPGDWSTTCSTHGRRFFTWRNDPFIPVEFSVAAYRFGHSQVRPSYRANFGTSATRPDAAVLRAHLRPGATEPGRPRRPARRAPRAAPLHRLADLLRLRRRPRAPQQAIDTTLSTPLFHLLGQPPGEPVSLATRNLLRNLTMQVPSGQRVAAAMQLPAWRRKTSPT